MYLCVYDQQVVTTN